MDGVNGQPKTRPKEDLRATTADCVKRSLLAGVVCASWIIGVTSTARSEESVSFARQIQPILARRCFACHGPDEEERQAELRLDVAEAVAESGLIEPGDPESSELIRRVTTNDADERMPPADAGEALTEEERALLVRWVEQGAKYEPHWAFVPPVRPAVPEVRDAAWPRNDVDRFVLARIEAAGKRPAAEADRYTLVRRVYLDLVGLPPSPEEADAYVNDPDPLAYERLVDRLLASEHYGERWARLWLDLARYADTNGYEKDRPRSIWPYRDWVISALNADMPFDQFTIEQLAGDMLPEATTSQRIATGFHRNTMLNEEGGIDPLEFRFYAMVDRVATTGLVWMGLTTGCAQCHSHKYDPISHTDYYRLMALLDNADEPDFVVPDAEVAARRQAVEAKIAALETKLAEQFPAAEGGSDDDASRRTHFDQRLGEWIAQMQGQVVAWDVWRPVEMTTNLPKLELLPDGSIFSSGDITKRDVYRLKFPLEDRAVTAMRIEVLPDERLPGGGPGRAFYEGRKGDFFLSEVAARVDGEPVTLDGASHSFGKISIGSGSADAGNVLDGDGSTGWSTATREGEAHHLVLNLAEAATGDELELELLFERHFAASLGRFRVSATRSTRRPAATEHPVEVEAILARDEAAWSEADRSAVEGEFLRTAPELAEARKEIDALRKQMPAAVTTMVMEERPADNPRGTHRHHRGEYLSTREEVAPGIPNVLAAHTDEPPTNRLELAGWLVSEANPLAARVTVNRQWRALFGAGLVRTSGDFGTQSEPPTHPALLDWLACEFMEDGWSLKRLHRLLVTSATYRQSSDSREEAIADDPENRLWARGPRHRLDAEMVRDAMLRASGLLSSKQGGPGVRPPQPASVTALAYGNVKWDAAKGADRHRRSIYTFAKRTAPFAAYAVFDAPTGEECVPRRGRSNTPLQALTLMNDAMYVEMAQALARQVMAGEAADARGRAEVLFRRLLTRPPTEAEFAAVLEFHAAQLARLEAGELAAAAICGVDEEDHTDDLPLPLRAAWVMTARAVMNLDEAITKR